MSATNDKGQNYNGNQYCTIVKDNQGNTRGKAFKTTIHLAFDLESKTKEYLRLMTKYEQLKGEFSGFCKGILWWDIPEELKVKINEQIKRLEQ